MRVSLNMIVLNAKEGVVRCLLSIKDFVDEVVIVDTGSTDGTQDAIREVCPDAKLLEWIDPERHPEKGWLSDFSAARNKAIDASTGDAILWLDADDVVAHTGDVIPGLALRSKIEECIGRSGVDVMEIRYDYKKDEYGNSLLVLPRYRVWKRGAMRWHWPVHEDPRPQRFLKKADLRRDEVYIDHLKVESQESVSAERNLWIMEKYLAAGGEMDARLWSNFGGSYRALKKYRESIEAYDKGLAMDALGEDAYISWIRSADCALWMRDFQDAVRRYMRAQALFPQRKGSYLGLCETYIQMDKPTEALAYAEIAENLNRTGDEGFVWLEEAAETVPMVARAKANMLWQNYEEALRMYEQLLARYPRNAEFKAQVEQLQNVLMATSDYKAFERVATLIPVESRRGLLQQAPEYLYTHGAVAKARKPERPKGKPVMAIYCGNSNAPWGPFSVDEGIGGSEEAVIFLSQEMAKLGWYVEVYGFPPKDQINLIHEGVCWLPFFTWGEDEPVDVFVGWRQTTPRHVFAQGGGQTSGQRWLWLHDVCIPQIFRMPWVDSLDGIFTLSDFHAKPIEEPARSKVVMTKNGLDPRYLVDGKHDPDEFIFASSPDRGMDCVLEEWPKIRAARPKARLHLYYGFTENYIRAMAANPKLATLKTKIEGLLDQPGVEWHGMVGQMELAKAFADCGFWLYPTAWPETSCITGMKAQALGCIPITSRYKESGVPETVRWDLGPEARDSIIYDDPEWRSAWTASVIAAAERQDLGEYREKMMSWARETFSWAKVAAQWNGLFRARSSERSGSVSQGRLQTASRS